MADNRTTTENLIVMYSRNDLPMRMNFKLFMHLSWLSRLSLSSRILDCGCAMGHLMSMLRGEGFTELTGLDAAQEMVEAARRLTGFPVQYGDALDISAHFEPKSFDAVIISDLFHHLASVEQWTRLISGCNQVLRAGGKLFIREPYPTTLIITFQLMSRYQVFYVGFLKPRLQSFVEEAELVEYFFAHWPNQYKQLLTNAGFQIEKDFSMFIQRVTVCSNGGLRR